MYISRIRVRSFTALAAVALGLVLAGTVLGAALQKNGGPVTAVRTVTATDRALIESSPTAASFEWNSVPGMALTVTVPAAEKGLFVITFSAQTQCNGDVAFCYVRVLVDGTAAPPGAVVFDSTDDGPGGSVNSYETNSMQFVAGFKQAGSHTVTVQYSIYPSTYASFSLEQRTLTVLRSRV